MKRMKNIYGLIVLVVCLLIGINISSHKVSAGIGVSTESDGINVGEFYFDSRINYDFDGEESLFIDLDYAETPSIMIAGQRIKDSYIEKTEFGLIISKKAFSKLIAGSYEMEITNSKNSVYRIQLLFSKASKVAAGNSKDKDLGLYYYDSKKHPEYYEIELKTKGFSSFYLMTYLGGMGISEDFTYDGETLRVYSKRYSGKISGAFELSCYDEKNDKHTVYTFIINEKSVKHPYSTKAIYSTKNVSIGNKYRLNNGASKLKISTDYLTTDASIATVSKSGVITVKKKGKVYVSAFVKSEGCWVEHKILLTAKKGSTTGKTYNLTSIALKNKLPTITMNKDIYVGSKMKVYTEMDDIKYSTKNKKVAYINKKGYIVGKSNGKTTVSSTINTELYDWKTGDINTTKLVKVDFNIKVIKK